MKIVINNCFGGFSVTEAVYNELGVKWDGYGYIENKDLGIESDDYHAYRQDTKLINAIEKVGLHESSGSCAELKIVDIPEDVDFYIHDYDGMETINEKHRSW